MTIKQNPDTKHANKIRQMLKDNDFYCPCNVEKTEDTKCMCKEFRDKIENNERATCRCGLYIAEVD